MSSDVLSENWNPDKAGTTYRDLERQKWEEKAIGCWSNHMNFCNISGGQCTMETCFARYWGMI